MAWRVNVLESGDGSNANEEKQWRGSIVVAWPGTHGATSWRHAAFPMQKEMDVGCQGDGSRRPTEQGSIRPRRRHRFVPLSTDEGEELTGNLLPR